jgi:SAM-dependent methyltransferase
MLGFSSIHSIDVSNYEGAAEIFDLNSASVPTHLAGAFDFIVDGGTIEHVFHLPNVLNNIYRMLKVGGRILHVAPSSNHVDHGFYMFSPTLFVDYYTVNRFELNCVQVFRYTQQHASDSWELSDYVPGCLDPISFGGLDDSLYGVAVVATKREESTGNAIPIQGAARALAKNSAAPEAMQPRRRLIDRILRRILRRPRKKGLGLPISAKF